MAFASFVGSRDSGVRVASGKSKAEAKRSKQNYPAKSKVQIDDANTQHNSIDDGRDDAATATSQPGVITPGKSTVPLPRDSLERDGETRTLPPGKECEENARIDGDLTIVVDEKGVETRANLDNDECIHGDVSDAVDDLTPVNHDIGASDISSSSVSGTSNSDRNSSISNASKHLRKWKAETEKEATATMVTNECDQELHTALPGAAGVWSFVIEGDVMISVDEEGIEARANNQRVISQDIEHALGSCSDCPSLDDITASIVDDGSIVSERSSASSISSRRSVKSIHKWIRKKSKIRLNSTTQRKLSNSLSNSLKTKVMQRSRSRSRGELDIASKAEPPIVRHRPFSSPPSTCKPIPAYGHLWGIDQEKYYSLIGDTAITANKEPKDNRDNGKVSGYCHGCEVFPNDWNDSPPALLQFVFPDMNCNIDDSTVDNRSKTDWKETVKKLNILAAPSCFSDNSSSGSCEDRATEKPLPELLDFGFKRDVCLGWSDRSQALRQLIFPEIDFSCDDSTTSKSTWYRLIVHDIDFSCDDSTSSKSTWQRLITPSCFSEASSYSATSQVPGGYQ